MNTDKIYLEFLKHLYLTREFLTSQKGQYKDPNAPDYPRLTWSGYCAEIGISYTAANSWLRTLTRVIKTPDGHPGSRGQLLFKIPAGFAAAAWWLNNQKKKPAGKTKPARRRRA
jgi:hypothetical protein